MGRVYWTRSRCFREAKKYKRITDFRFYASGAFRSAYNNGWLGDYTWFRKYKKWTKEECMDIALKYHTKNEMRNNSPAAYWFAYKRGWVDEYWWFIDWEVAKDEWGKVIGYAIRVYAEKGLDECKEECRRKSEDETLGDEVRKLYRYVADSSTEKWFTWAKKNWYYYYPEKRYFKKKKKDNEKN